MSEVQPINKGQASPSLPRVLGLWDIVSIVVGGVIGSGIFLVPSNIAAAVRYPLLIMAVWVVGGLLSLFGALTFAELGAAYPQAGGMYVYLREAYGPLLSFLFGWTLFLVIDSGAIATLAVAFSSRYLPYFFQISPAEMKLIAIGLIVVLALVNVLSTRWGANLQNLLTVIKFGALVAVCVTVFLFAPGRTSHFVQPALPLSEIFPLTMGKLRHYLDLLMRMFGVALIASLWAYKGWEGATYSAGETRRPERNIPLGLLTGTLICIGIYIVANLAYLYAFPAGQIARSDRIASQAMNMAIGPLGAAIIAIIILFSITGAANQNFLCSPRVYFAMAKDGLFFKQVATVHPAYLTPHVSILALGAWSVILVLFFGTFERLFTYVIFGQWIFFGLTGAAVMVLRAKRPDLHRPYKTFGYPVIPIIFILSAVFISLNSLMGRPRDTLIGLLIIFLGVPVYFLFALLGGKPKAA
jgi:APA family basic amino acid/polyamine antiporter